MPAAQSSGSESAARVLWGQRSASGLRALRLHSFRPGPSLPRLHPSSARGFELRGRHLSRPVSAL